MTPKLTQLFFLPIFQAFTTYSLNEVYISEKIFFFIFLIFVFIMIDLFPYFWCDYKGVTFKNFIIF